MGLLSEKDYTNAIQALEYFLQVWDTQLTEADRMEKQALVRWLYISKSKLSNG